MPLGYQDVLLNEGFPPRPHSQSWCHSLTLSELTRSSFSVSQASSVTRLQMACMILGRRRYVRIKGHVMAPRRARATRRARAMLRARAMRERPHVVPFCPWRRCSSRTDKRYLPQLTREVVGSARRGVEPRPGSYVIVIATAARTAIAEGHCVEAERIPASLAMPRAHVHFPSPEFNTQAQLESDARAASVASMQRSAPSAWSRDALCIVCTPHRGHRVCHPQSQGSRTAVTRCDDSIYSRALERSPTFAMRTSNMRAMHGEVSAACPQGAGSMFWRTKFSGRRQTCFLGKT